MKSLNPELFSEHLHKAKRDLRALEHKLRLRIINFLDENPDSYVKEIYKTLKIEQSVASQHLTILKNSDYVISNRDGKRVYYNVNYDRIKDVISTIDSFLEEE